MKLKQSYVLMALAYLFVSAVMIGSVGYYSMWSPEAKHRNQVYNQAQVQVNHFAAMDHTSAGNCQTIVTAITEYWHNHGQLPKTADEFQYLLPGGYGVVVSDEPGRLEFRAVRTLLRERFPGDRWNGIETYVYHPIYSDSQVVGFDLIAYGEDTQVAVHEMGWLTGPTESILKDPGEKSTFLQVRTITLGP